MVSLLLTTLKIVKKVLLRYKRNDRMCVLRALDKTKYGDFSQKAVWCAFMKMRYPKRRFFHPRLKYGTYRLSNFSLISLVISLSNVSLKFSLGKNSCKEYYKVDLRLVLVLLSQICSDKT